MLIPNNAFSSSGPSDAEVKAAIVKALKDSNHADAMETHKAMQDAQPDQLKRIVACHYGEEGFSEKAQALCRSIFAKKHTDTARVYVTVCGTLSPFWMDANFDPKKTAQEWIDRMDKADGLKTAANLVVAYKEEDYVRVMAYTSDVTRMLRNSGKDGIFVSAATDEHIRKGYTPVWGPRAMTLAKMLDARDGTTPGLLRNEHGVGWRVQDGKVEAFRKKMGLSGPSTFYQVGPLPTSLLGDRIVAALSKWGWAGVTKVRCRLESKRQCTWTLRATGPPPCGHSGTRRGQHCPYQGSATRGGLAAPHRAPRRAMQATSKHPARRRRQASGATEKSTRAADNAGQTRQADNGRW